MRGRERGGEGDRGDGSGEDVEGVMIHAWM